jgi:receptor protein-tyrosine kinase
MERDRAARESAVNTPADKPPADNSAPISERADQSEAVPGSWQFEDSEPESVVSPADPADRLRDPIVEPEGPTGAAPPDQWFATLANATLAVGPVADPTLVEQHRHLAASLHHVQARTGAHTVMVTSAVEAEGKTTTAANVALTMSHSHRRQVLLIDADLRRPSLHALFNLDNSVGLVDALKGTTAKAPLHHISPTLAVMPAGRPMRDPMSVLVSETMKQLLTEAAERFDWVIIDTPPIALLSDANLLAAMVDQSLLVVRAATTPYPLVKRAIDALGPDRILGVVLNRAKRSNIVVGYKYNYYGYYAPTAKRPGERSFLPFRRSKRKA